MDRFKVRMWSKDAQKYFYGDIAHQCLMQQLAVGTESWYPIPYDHLSDGVVFERCTNRKDKNGSLIYRGDILNSQNDGSDGHDKWTYEDFKNLVVGWDDEFSRFTGMPCNNCDNSVYGFEYIEVIGNIHQGVKK